MRPGEQPENQSQADAHKDGARQEKQYARGLIDPKGSCSWLSPWALSYGALLRCRSPGSTLHRPPRLRRLIHSPQPHRQEPDPNGKAALRAAAMAKRDALSTRQREIGSESVAVRCRPIIRNADPGCLAGYVPIRSETDPSAVLREAHAAGRVLGLPAITGPTAIPRG